MLEYNVKDTIELNDRIIAIAGGLNEKTHMIAIDISNTFYRIDIAQRKVIYKSEKREEGSFGSKICIMNSREENWLACSKWDYEQNHIEIRSCLDFSVILRFHVRSHVNYLIELNGNHKLRGHLMAGFADGTCGIYKINI